MAFTAFLASERSHTLLVPCNLGVHHFLGISLNLGQIRYQILNSRFLLILDLEREKKLLLIAQKIIVGFECELLGLVQAFISGSIESLIPAAKPRLRLKSHVLNHQMLRRFFIHSLLFPIFDDLVLLQDLWRHGLIDESTLVHRNKLLLGILIDRRIPATIRRNLFLSGSTCYLVFDQYLVRNGLRFPNVELLPILEQLGLVVIPHICIRHHLPMLGRHIVS